MGPRAFIHRDGDLDNDSRQNRGGRITWLVTSAYSGRLWSHILAEMGDKTQIATVALAAQYHAFFSVVAGTTLGMMIANVPAVFLGDRIAHRMPVRLVHGIAAAIFLIFGLATLLARESVLDSERLKELPLAPWC